MSSIPFSLGYADFYDATRGSVAIASLINKAGNIVVASAQTVAFALMEQGGVFDGRLTANLQDGASSSCWPMTGYTYFIIRTNTHIGSCNRRRAAMQFLYDFYFSTAVNTIVQQLGYSPLTSFIRDIVVSKLIDMAKCSNGEYALSQYRTADLNILTTYSFSSPLRTYLSAYYNIFPSAVWNVVTNYDSYQLFNKWRSDGQESTVAVFSMFMSAKTKLLQYINTTSSTILTTAFAHVAVVPIYHLNAFAAHVSSPLRLTAQILAGIYCGEITYWNDSLIQQANSMYRQYLPYLPIIVVYRSSVCDDNRIITRYLSRVSASFRNTLNIIGDDGVSTLNMSWAKHTGSVIGVPTNVLVDSTVTFYDGSIGYYLQDSLPTSTIAAFCPDQSCSTVIHPTNSSSLTACEDDPNTVVRYGTALFTYDLMISSNTMECYPMVGTIDYTLSTNSNDPSCLSGEGGIAHQRVEFGSWLFNGPTLVRPLLAISMAGSSLILRSATRKSICDITCYSGVPLGYSYCSYRTCLWTSGDYVQYVSACYTNTEKRQVTYALTPGNTCIEDKSRRPSDTTIQCDHVIPYAFTGVLAICTSTVNMLFALISVVFLYQHRAHKKYKKTKLIYLYIFLFGVICLNMSSFAYIGTLTSFSCIIRTWVYNLSLTLMFGPLVTKMYLLDKLYWNSPTPAQSGRLTAHRKLRNVVISDTRVVVEIIILLTIDILLLLVWTTQERPQAVTINQTYPGVLDTVQVKECSAMYGSQLVLISYKILLFFFGIFYATKIWTMPAELNDSKPFVVAIILGIVAYALDIYVVYYNVIVVIRFVAIFFACVISVFLIVYPRSFQRKVSGMTHASGSSRSSSSSHGSNASRGSARRRSFGMVEPFQPMVAARAIEDNVASNTNMLPRRSLGPSLQSHSIREYEESKPTVRPPSSRLPTSRSRKPQGADDWDTFR